MMSILNNLTVASLKEIPKNYNNLIIACSYIDSLRENTNFYKNEVTMTLRTIEVTFLSNMLTTRLKSVEMMSKLIGRLTPFHIHNNYKRYEYPIGDYKDEDFYCFINKNNILENIFFGDKSHERLIDSSFVLSNFVLKNEKYTEKYMKCLKEGYSYNNGAYKQNILDLLEKLLVTQFNNQFYIELMDFIKSTDLKNHTTEKLSVLAKIVIFSKNEFFLGQIIQMREEKKITEAKYSELIDSMTFYLEDKSEVKKGFLLLVANFFHKNSQYFDDLVMILSSIMFFKNINREEMEKFENFFGITEKIWKYLDSSLSLEMNNGEDKFDFYLLYIVRSYRVIFPKFDGNQV